MEKTAEKLMPIITALTTARHRAGLSQRALADKVGLAQSHISKIERGAVDPQTTSVVEVARVLGLELSLVPISLMPSFAGPYKRIHTESPSASEFAGSRADSTRPSRALMRYLPNLKVLPASPWLQMNYALHD